MRKYCIGIPVGSGHPTKVIAACEPLIKPDENEREVRSQRRLFVRQSGTRKQLIIPYAMSDYATTFATLRSTALSAMNSRYTRRAARRFQATLLWRRAVLERPDDRNERAPNNSLVPVKQMRESRADRPNIFPMNHRS